MEEINQRLKKMAEDKLFEENFNKDLEKIKSGQNLQDDREEDIYDQFALGKIGMDKFMEMQDAKL